MTLGPHIGTVQVPYPTLPYAPSLPLREEPMLAVGLTSLGSPIPAGYWTKTITTALVEVLH